MESDKLSESHGNLPLNFSRFMFFFNNNDNMSWKSNRMLKSVGTLTSHIQLCALISIVWIVFNSPLCTFVLVNQGIGNVYQTKGIRKLYQNKGKTGIIILDYS